MKRLNSVLMSLALLLTMLMVNTQENTTVNAQENTYQDPQGRYTVPVPANWTVTETADYALLAAPDGDLNFYFLVRSTQDDLERVVETGWSLADPDFAGAVEQRQNPPAPAGVDEFLIIQYAFNPADNIVRQAIAQRVGADVHLLLVEASLPALQQRAAQVNIINTGYTITGLTGQTDLTDAAMKPIDDALLAEWTAYIEAVLAEYGIPGAAIAVVHEGNVLFSQGFGTTIQGGDVPVTPSTHMMIGSTGKSLTTTMMAAMVDAGLFDWDTPVIEVLPGFAVADPEISRTITMRNLVCACTGVPRRDFEFIFNANDLTAEDVVESLSSFEFFTAFGEAFQYSNQMVATGGYAAGAATAGGSDSSLFDLYSAALNAYVLEPLNMPNTTVSFEAVMQRNQYATPHGFGLDGQYQVIPVLDEQVLVPVAPAGSHWSTLEDMTAYMIMQLQNGVAADGVQVVSAENLLVTREPQVPLSADESYGLGWFIGKYKGLHQVQHGGNTLGFTSSFVFLPERELGVIVLTNAQYTTQVSTAITHRLFDLVFDDVDAEADAEALTFNQQQYIDSFRTPADRLGVIDAETAAEYVGNYANEALGALSVLFEGGRLIMDIGEFKMELQPLQQTEETSSAGTALVVANPPLTGRPVRFNTTSTGSIEIVFGEGVTEYIFRAVR